MTRTSQTSLASYRALGWNSDAMIATPIATGTTISSTAPYRDRGA